jgi:hypothetical protein
LQIVKASSFSASLEPNHLSRSDNKRPDGITISQWSRGKSLLWDASCIDSFPVSYIDKALWVSGQVAALERSLQGSDGEFFFTPFIVETTGVWGKCALINFAKSIVHAITLASGEKRAFPQKAYFDRYLYLTNGNLKER